MLVDINKESLLVLLAELLLLLLLVELLLLGLHLYFVAARRCNYSPCKICCSLPSCC